MKPLQKYLLLFVSVTSLVGSCNSPKEEPSEPVDLVYPLLDTENSRWFFFSSACRPFGMVNLSPDTEIDGAWGSGYRYNTDTIKGFSHIHAWQLSGLSVMPVSSKNDAERDIYRNYYSWFDHQKEKVFPGYHRVTLERYGIQAELTSTKRVGFHRYTFPSENKQIVVNIGGPLGPSEITDGSLQQLSPRIFTGQLVNAPTFRRPKETAFFFELNWTRTSMRCQPGQELMENFYSV